MSLAYIFSINPFPVPMDFGAMGTFVAPARVKDERYSRFEVKDRIVKNDKGGDNFTDEVVSGEATAKGLVSVNPALGLIVCLDPRGPTKDQVLAAQEEMTAADELRLARGDDLYSRTKDRSKVSNDCRQACLRLGRLREWVDQTDQDKQLKKCRYCAEMILPDAIGCKHCGWNQLLDPTVPAITAPPPPASKPVVQG